MNELTALPGSVLILLDDAQTYLSQALGHGVSEEAAAAIRTAQGHLRTVADVARSAALSIEGTPDVSPDA